MFTTFGSVSSVSEQVLSVDCVMGKGVVDANFAGSVFFGRNSMILVLPFIAAVVLGLFWSAAHLVYRLRNRGERFMHQRARRASDGTVDAADLRARRASDAQATSPSPAGAVPRRASLTIQPPVNYGVPAPALSPDSSSAGTNAGVSILASPISPTGGAAPLSPTGSGAAAGGDALAVPYRVTITRFFADRFVVSLIVVLFLAHFSLTRGSLSMFSCKRLSDDLEGSFLVADLNVRCDVASSRVWMYGVGIPAFIVFALGIPAGALAVLLLNQADLQSAHVREQYGFLYAMFKRRTFAWEVVVAVRKVALALVAVLVAPVGPIPQTLSGVIVVVVSMMLHSQYQPYNLEVLNQVEQASLLTAFLTLIGGLFIWSLETQAGRYGASMIVIVLNALLLSLFLRSFLFITMQREQLVFDDGVSGRRRLSEVPGLLPPKSATSASVRAGRRYSADVASGGASGGGGAAVVAPTSTSAGAGAAHAASPTSVVVSEVAKPIVVAPTPTAAAGYAAGAGGGYGYAPEGYGQQPAPQHAYPPHGYTGPPPTGAYATQQWGPPAAYGYGAPPAHPAYAGGGYVPYAPALPGAVYGAASPAAYGMNPLAGAPPGGAVTGSHSDPAAAVTPAPLVEGFAAPPPDRRAATPDVFVRPPSDARARRASNGLTSPTAAAGGAAGLDAANGSTAATAASTPGVDRGASMGQVQVEMLAGSGGDGASAAVSHPAADADAGARVEDLVAQAADEATPGSPSGRGGAGGSEGEGAGAGAGGSARGAAPHPVVRDAFTSSRQLPDVLGGV
jgi:hypothetical protein